MYEQKRAPIVEALKNYVQDGVIRFHMPGHKGGLHLQENLLFDWLGGGIFSADVTNVPGMDDLHQTDGVIKEAQDLAARAFGADSTYFLINGSSCGLQALIVTICQNGDKILVPRNMHRSMLSGLIQSGAIPVFYSPEYDGNFGIPLGTAPETIEECLNNHPDIKAVLLVNPTYHGVTSDIPSIANIVHARNIPLLVDEAHGPHLFFHEDLPPTSLEGGADAVVQGTHKILTAFTQASMLHVKGNMIDRQRLEATLRLLQSTSTSYLLLASLDAARAQMAMHGNELLNDALKLAGYLREEIKSISGFTVLEKDTFGNRGLFDLDPTKVTVSIKGLGITGFGAENWLRENHQIQVEMSDIYNLLFIVSFGNRRTELDCLIKALREMAVYAETNQLKDDMFAIQNENDSFVPGIPQMVMSPRKAFNATPVTLPLRAAVGRVSSEVIACYPPGIPVIFPGEIVTAKIVDYLEYMISIGAHFQGCSDLTLKTMRVVK